MASKKDAKKKIKNEYQRLEEDILHHMAINKEADHTKSKELLEQLKEARKAFISELNQAGENTNEFFKNLFSRVVDDVDKNYKILKDLVDKE